MENRLNNTFEIDETYESPNWIRCKIRSLAFNRNRNGSDILSSTFSETTMAKKSLGAVPVVAKYNEETDNLEGHNVTIRKNKEDKYEPYHDTNALGFTSPQATFHLEEVNEGDNSVSNYKTYVTIEDVYLWKRFDATKKIIEWNKEGIPARVSVELDEVKGKMDSDGYFQIEDFNLSAICVLGSDVEPCFGQTEIQMYTVNEFREELKTLMTELNYSTQEGGKEMPTENEEKVVKDYEKTEVEFESVEETESTETETTEEVEVTEETQTDTTSDNPDNESDAPGTFEDESPTVDTEEVTEKNEEAEEKVETEDEPTVDYEAKYTDVQGKLDELEINYAKLQSQLSELQTYKRQREEADLKAKFEGKLSDEEFGQVFTELKEESLEKVEEKLFALIGKKNFSIQTPTKTNVNKVTIVSPKEETYNPYGGIFD